LPAMQAGALGYLLKDSSSKELIQAILDVQEGKLALHPAITRKVMRELGHPSGKKDAAEALTKREEDVLKLVAQGLSNQAIADTLCLSERTVARHISSLLSKLALENRTQAALYALRMGMADLEAK
jgi:NarL family two-component system response regulator LiaR